MAYDANKHLTAFHDDRVFVADDMLGVARSRRTANRNRLKAGLKADNEPVPKDEDFVPQGSYAMHTMVQSEVESSDIDDGVVFSREALKGPKGGDKSSTDAKEMVRKALAAKDEFKKPPEVRSNCVRVHYNDGFHVDIPVYRTYEEQGTTKKELASSGEWKVSAPEDITNWFNGQVTAKSPDTTKGRQMRRVVRLLKYWSKSRSSWKMPSGFVLSVLTDEAYASPGHAERDDRALLAVMRGIRNRLQMQGIVVKRPVEPREEITSERTYGKVRNLRDELANAIDELSKIEQADCDELMALKALKAVFYTDYWDARIKELENGGGDGSKAQPAEPKQPVDKRGGSGQYA
ncbi:MAG: hypothetical protein J0L58_02740 [Burkholderiales bacterium]|nr:hypothetical protein [Burkholderiales bacterium]